DAAVVPELDVDELVGSVTGQSAHHEQPQILLALLRADAEVLGGLVDRDAVMLDEPGHHGHEPGQTGLRVAHRPSSPCMVTMRCNASRTRVRIASGSSTTTPEPAEHSCDTRTSSDRAVTVSSMSWKGSPWASLA